MRRLTLVSLLALLATLLAQTNPHQKAGYIEATAIRVQQNCCPAIPVQSNPDSRRQVGATTCRTLQPLLKPVLKPLLSFYTATPRNYLLFTVYSTQLPSASFRAIGIGGHYLFWPSLPLPKIACQGQPPGWFGQTTSSLSRKTVAPSGNRNSAEASAISHRR